MKKIFFPIFLLLLTFSVFANQIDVASAKKIVLHNLISASKNTNYSIKGIYPISEDEIIYFYLAEIAPKGYFIISADDNLPPVIAYSFENNADIQSSITGFFKFDLKTRLDAVVFLPEEVIKERKAMWNKLLSDDYSRDREFEQWPEEGTTSTGGWLESSWNQGAPWNAMCPVDPVTSARSYTGCPATAMAMILDFHKTANNLYFTDADDYDHNYAGRNFRFDDDWETIGFPSFTTLNTYLATLYLHWQNSEPLTNEDMAALSFACGLTAHQVYTSEGSGTFSVSQAYDAYMRINCSTALLYTETDEELFPTLILNMQHALPAHLAIVDEAWSMGHNIVVDGYNTDNYFHINFGWGGTYNGWYLIPDEMPYEMTVIEGIIVDIMKDNSSENYLPTVKSDVEIYPNPANNTLFINHSDRIRSVEIFDNVGKAVIRENQLKNQSQIDIKNLNKGTYFIRIIFEDKSFWNSGFIKL